jgi:acetoacetyl-CoA synthetase
LYSSGTTGLPKPIVQGHGGILLEHLKQIGLQSDLGPDDRFFWFSTTGWMMWTYLVGGLLVGSTVVLYDGNPGFPNLSTLWRMAEEEKLTYFGTSAPFLMACRKAGLSPKKEYALSSLRAVGSTGAPLPKEGFDWVYDAVKGDVLLASVSGGTDLCTAFLGSSPWHPVRAGELQCASLGAKVEAYGEDGRPLIGEVGELVLSEPMPSMPVGFWGDPEGERYHASYFEHFPGVWRHGDWVRFYEDGSSVIYGRSDSTLNRGGVRMGTSEFYRVVEGFDEVVDSLVVDTSSLEREGELWLFLVLREGQSLEPPLLARLRSTIRAELSPRHIPDAFIQIREVPRTLSGKKLEVPIKRIASGMPLDEAVNPGTLKSPSALYELLEAIPTRG